MTHTGPSGATAVAASARTPYARDVEAARVRFRRALTLLLMTLVLPGSAQLVLGRRAVGRAAVRVWLGCWAVLLLTVAVGVLDRGFVFWAGLNPGLLGALRLLLCALAIGWVLLFLDAWRLGEPLQLRQKQRLVVVGLNGAFTFLVAGALLFGSHLVAVHRDLVLAVSGDGDASAAQDGRYNVLLVGGDSGVGRYGLRTDSLTVASIDADTGRTVLFGLPRNMTDFPFPEGSVLGEAFPDGYDCETCTLNSLATWAADNPDRFAGTADPGMAATIEGVEGITGLPVNYYAMVDLDGFRSLVAAMGGLTLNVRDRIPIGLPVRRYIEPGVRELDGFETLWFARSRESADDYSRMARQKCVMSAMLQQLSPQVVITRFAALAEAGEHILTTDLPASELDTFAELALKAKAQRISTVSFVPPVISTSSPDIAKVHAMVATAVERAEGDGGGGGGGRSRPSQGFDARSAGPSTGGSIGSMSEGYRANQADDLSKAC
ncbi:MAG: Cell envelope-related transcriptional attenuator [uncultured Nocardioidaceae bacterium]|uniref:Cell envelope-related transcriptional attenuator n=1 Tax=uncultured Nocardioidaceae bacterium TaxID=253824 RepID=A0A6J4M0R8_9ACTN|nr:MAG: Cell envelope-related transcriptional attenuator [uncultured Nocardioidaceae bacterium]